MITTAPRGFKLAGSVEWAKISDETPQFRKSRRKTARQLQGIRYERLAQQHLLELYPEFYIPSPWLRFLSSGSGIRYCQPDGLLVDVEHGTVTIVEIKYQHTSDAWWQLRKLYEPVLRTLFPTHLWEIRVLEVVKWYDKAVSYPEPTVLLKTPDLAKETQLGYTGVHIWKP